MRLTGPGELSSYPLIELSELSLDTSLFGWICTLFRPSQLLKTPNDWILEIGK